MDLMSLVTVVSLSRSTFEISSDALVPLSVSTPAFLPLAEQSPGQYLYPVSDSGYILLRKAGQSVIGVDARRSRPLCFRGLLEGDRVVNAMRIFPPYDPDSRWDTRDGTMVDLSQYQQAGQADEMQEEALQKCLEVFAR
jgi:hypothetical protein